MAPDAGTSRPEAEATWEAIATLLDTLRTDILGRLDALKRTADQLPDYVLVEQVPWVRDTVERLAPLVDEGLARGRASAGAVLEWAKGAAPHVAAAQQYPWRLLGSALLVSYLVAGGDSRAPTPPPSQP